VDRPELLELGYGSHQDVAANLAEMDRINRYLGGLRALTRHLYPRLLAQHGRLTLVDLGTGSAMIPVVIARWARRRGLDLRILAVDCAARQVRIARSNVKGYPEVQLVRADALHAPLPAGKVDYVISSLLLHHLAPGRLVEMLRATGARARCGLIMSDLARGWLPFYAFKLVQRLFARHPLTRYDGALSILRAYTPAELLDLAEAAGLPNPQVFAHWPARMTLVVDQ
jgi:hypothetical protein